MSNDNPYAAPQFAVEPLPEYSQFPLASQGQRFANLIVDSIATQVLGFIAGIVITLVLVGTEGPDAETESIGLQVFSGLVGIGISLSYYLVMEATWGRTVGKFVTGTRVVAEGGGSPTFGQILGRTACRMIPFEAFSFLGTEAVGWHDSIPKTRVVKIR